MFRTTSYFLFAITYLHQNIIQIWNGIVLLMRTASDKAETRNGTLIPVRSVVRSFFPNRRMIDRSVDVFFVRSSLGVN